MTDRHGPHHTPEEDDRFTRWGEEATGVLETHWRKLVGGLVLCIALGGAWAAYDHNRNTREMAAQAQVAQIVDLYPGDSPGAIPESSIRAAATRYETFLKDAPEGPARFIAQLYVAQAYDALGEGPRARASYEALQEAPAPFSGPARLRLAYLALTEGDTQRASAAFEAVAANDPGLAPQAALELGRLAEQAGQPELAIAAYRKVSERFPAAPQAAEAQARVRALGGEPETPMPRVGTAPDAPPTEPAEEPGAPEPEEGP